MFFTQYRLGIFGLSFKIFKIKTMHNGKVTKYGAFLRKYHIDEIPQFLNIILRDMSIVGPRPETYEEYVKITEYLPKFWDRLIVRPGLTGLAQVRYIRPETPKEQRRKLQYDLFYIRKKTLWLDLWIIKETIKKVFNGA